MKQKLPKMDRNEEERGAPTISFLPGTTLKPFRVENVKVGCDVYDTPGIFSEKRVTDLIRDIDSIKKVMRTKLDFPFSVELDEGGAVWVGALCRIDHI